MKRNYRWCAGWSFAKTAIFTLAVMLILSISGIESAGAVDFPQEGGQPGNRYMDFSAEKPDGEKASLSELIDGRPAMLFFYSFCCGHCNQELAKFSPLTEDMDKDGIAVIGIQWRSPGVNCPYIKKKHKLTADFLVDLDGSICKRYGVGDFTLMTVDAEGIIRYRGGLENITAIKKSLGKSYEN